MTRLRELQDALDVLRDVENDGIRNIIELTYEIGEFKNRRPFEFEGEEETHDARKLWCFEHDCPQFYIHSHHKGYVRFLRKHPGATFNQIMKFFYTEDRIANLAARSHPLLNLIKKESK